MMRGSSSLLLTSSHRVYTRPMNETKAPRSRYLLFEADAVHGIIERVATHTRKAEAVREARELATAWCNPGERIVAEEVKTQHGEGTLYRNPYSDYGVIVVKVPA